MLSQRGRGILFRVKLRLRLYVSIPPLGSVSVDYQLAERGKV